MRVGSEEILGAVARELGVSVDELQRRQSPGPLSDARRIAIHVARACGLPLARIADSMHVTRQRASRVASTTLTPHELRALRAIVQGVLAE
jgi:hypothetical protein